MLKFYYKRVTSCQESRFNRILGIFEFEESNTHIILLENILPNKDTAYIFDLKGSTFQRATLKCSSEACTGKVMKDLDFKRLEMELKLSEEEQRHLINSIKEDVDILQELGIMDYSLLVGVYESPVQASSRYTIVSSCGRVYNIALIDFLQRYNLSKKAEREVKRFLSSDDPSAISPNKYAERFVSFLQKIMQSSQEFHFVMSL
jgi:1-phosphatidylinositol-4-phosphate 5-kinase